MRSAGSQGWAGVCNTHFWFDPAKDDVAGLIMTQTLPFVEPRFMKVYEQIRTGSLRKLITRFESPSSSFPRRRESRVNNLLIEGVAHNFIVHSYSRVSFSGHWRALEYKTALLKAGFTNPTRLL
ncbi:MAG: hypothetical protein R3F53_19160 [Gammaproteobacteria bacterium]